MIKIENLIRKNILELKPYSSARDEFKGAEGIFLDANENPFGLLNRYPDPYQKTLKNKLSSIKNIAVENIFIGNGSDEVIDLALRIFCNPGKDSVITCPPTYGMYEVSANINDLNIISIPLDGNFQLNVDKILRTNAKMIFICSPNNPTGNNLENIETIIEHFDGIVFVDEAYIDFSNQPSMISKINNYPNLIVSQTLSKAWGAAAVRIGLAYAQKDIISYFNKVKPPYNISLSNQSEALKILDQTDLFDKNKQTILSQRDWLIDNLMSLSIIEFIYPSDSNFVLVKTKNVHMIYQILIDNKIVIRNRHSVVNDCLRITVGDPSENIKLIACLKNISI